MDSFFEILLPLVIFLIALLTWWYGSMPKNLPPGPLGLPIIGCAHVVKTPTAHFTLTRWSKQYGPIFSFYQAQQLVVVLADYEIMQDGLQKQEVFHGKPVFMKQKSRPPKMGKFPTHYMCKVSSQVRPESNKIRGYKELKE